MACHSSPECRSPLRGEADGEEGQQARGRASQRVRQPELSVGAQSCQRPPFKGVSCQASLLCGHSGYKPQSQPYMVSKSGLYVALGK